MKISRRCLADYVKTLHQKVCCTCSKIIFLHSITQIIDLWRCRWRCRRQILSSLINYMMLIHESNVFELNVELKFEVCDPCIIFNTTYVVTRKAWKVQARTALKPWPWLIINPHNDKLPVGLITQLVKHCTAITEVSIPIKFRPSSKLHKWH